MTETMSRTTLGRWECAGMSDDVDCFSRLQSTHTQIKGLRVALYGLITVLSVVTLGITAAYARLAFLNVNRQHR